ncbi:MAG: symmetrical bis(5'-nucleosyl)-tetraphosphatase [Casimicrobiaceae bacterium]
MALYAIGDIQGCHAEFCDLLSLVGFSTQHDRLWLVGDLVNRGPASLAVLREVIALDACATTVLGNHDFHLLTVAAGYRRAHRGDTLAEILEAPDRELLLHWLTQRPLAVAEDGWLMVHAGVLPQWSCADVLALAHEVEAVLAGDDADAFLRVLYGDEPAIWSDDLDGYDRLRTIVNALTRLRFCTEGGHMEFREKRGAAFAPEGHAAWFLHGNRRTADVHVVCGHWSTLGLTLAPNVAMLDSGCLWGGALTALRLDDLHVFQVPSRAPIAPA